MDSVVARPSSPASNFMVGTQIPKSNELLVDATNPPKFPVTALVTAPAPTAGAEHTRVEPDPVQRVDASRVEEVPDDAEEAAVVEAAAAALVVSVESA